MKIFVVLFVVTVSVASYNLEHLTTTSPTTLVYIRRGDSYQFLNLKDRLKTESYNFTAVHSFVQSYYNLQTSAYFIGVNGARCAVYMANIPFTAGFANIFDIPITTSCDPNDVRLLVVQRRVLLESRYEGSLFRYTRQSCASQSPSAETTATSSNGTYRVIISFPDMAWGKLGSEYGAWDVDAGIVKGTKDMAQILECTPSSCYVSVGGFMEKLTYSGGSLQSQQLLVAVGELLCNSSLTRYLTAPDTVQGSVPSAQGLRFKKCGRGVLLFPDGATSVSQLHYYDGNGVIEYSGAKQDQTIEPSSIVCSPGTTLCIAKCSIDGQRQYCAFTAGKKYEIRKLSAPVDSFTLIQLDMDYYEAYFLMQNSTHKGLTFRSVDGSRPDEWIFMSDEVDEVTGVIGFNQFRVGGSCSNPKFCEIVKGEDPEFLFQQARYQRIGWAVGGANFVFAIFIILLCVSSKHPSGVDNKSPLSTP